MTTPIRIVMCADRNYAIPLHIALASVRHNLPSTHSLDVTVISTDLQADDICWRNKAHKDSLAVVQPFLPERTQTPISGHVSKATYFRLCLEQAIQPDVRRVVYLDCDLVVAGDVSQLWNVDLNGQPIGAVVDYSLGDWSHPAQRNLLEALNHRPRLPYFNAGVLIVDLPNWRGRRVMEKAFDFLCSTPDAAPFWDQDALNAVLCNNWHQLDPRWNRPSNYRWLRDQGKLPFSKDQVQSLNSPYVLHFVSGSKPWGDYRHPDKTVFDRYACIAGFPDFRLTFPKALLRKATRLLGGSTESTRCAP